MIPGRESADYCPMCGEPLDDGMYSRHYVCTDCGEMILTVMPLDGVSGDD